MPEGDVINVPGSPDECLQELVNGNDRVAVAAKALQALLHSRAGVVARTIKLELERNAHELLQPQKSDRVQLF